MSLLSNISTIQVIDPTPKPTSLSTPFPTTPPPTTAPPTSEGGQITPSTSPQCFGADDGGRNGVLFNAVRAYVDQVCDVNKVCPIAQTYGWPMNSWCVGNVKDMSYLFSGMNTFNEVISDWNTSSVTSMTHMFSYAKAFNRDLSNFDTSSVTNMYGMFGYARSFSGRGVSNFDLSSVTDMRDMFRGASSFSQNLCSWQDSFPYAQADIFLDSGCTYQDTPNATQKGPFCASNCQYLQVVSSASIFFSPVLVGVILMIFFLSRQLLVLLFHQQ